MILVISAVLTLYEIECKLLKVLIALKSFNLGG